MSRKMMTCRTLWAKYLPLPAQVFVLVRRSDALGSRVCLSPRTSLTTTPARCAHPGTAAARLTAKLSEVCRLGHVLSFITHPVL